MRGVEGKVSSKLVFREWWTCGVHLYGNYCKEIV